MAKRAIGGTRRKRSRRSLFSNFAELARPAVRYDRNDSERSHHGLVLLVTLYID